MAFTYDLKGCRYRDEKTGKFVSVKQVRQLAQASLDETSAIVAKLAPKALKAALRDEIKKETIRQYILGRGGVNKMMAKDWGSIGQVVREQYSYLTDFIAELDTLSEAQIQSRITMYINSAREGFERGKRQAIEVSGQFTEERWKLGGSNPCDDCKNMAAKGWVKLGSLGQFPGDGSTKCLTHCTCEVVYR